MKVVEIAIDLLQVLCANSVENLDAKNRGKTNCKQILNEKLHIFNRIGNNATSMEIIF